MGHKAVETTCSINSAFGSRTANKHIVQWWFKNCCKGDESLDNKEHSAQPSKADDDRLRAIIKADPLKTTRGVAEELNVDQCWHSTVVWHLKQTGKVGASWANHKSKTLLFWSVVFSYSVQQQQSILRLVVMCDKKWTVSNNQWWPAQWLDQEEASKHLPKPNLKVMVTVWWSASFLIHCNFLNPSEIITSETYAQQTDEIHWKLQHLHPALVNRKGPVLLHDNVLLQVTQPMLQKLKEGLLQWSSGYESTLQCKECRFNPWSGN